MLHAFPWKDWLQVFKYYLFHNIHLWAICINILDFIKCYVLSTKCVCFFLFICSLYNEINLYLRTCEKISVSRMAIVLWFSILILDRKKLRNARHFEWKMTQLDTFAESLLIFKKINCLSCSWRIFILCFGRDKKEFWIEGKILSMWMNFVCF